MSIRALFVAMIYVCGLVSANAQSISAAEARKVFDRYVMLMAAYDAAVADLYADNARVRSLRRYPKGQDRMLELDGTQWKQLIVTALPTAKSRKDRSDFRSIRTEVDGERIRIRAERYSTLRCYWDRAYYMVLARQADGSIKIVEEYAETKPTSDC